MGIIDQTTFKLFCSVCGVSEVVVAYQKGSQFSGGHWQGSVDFSRFRASWSGGGVDEPKITQAICGACGASASVSVGYA